VIVSNGLTAKTAQALCAGRCLRLWVSMRPPSTGRLELRHASKPEQFDAAFAALGKRLVVSVENAA